MGALAGQNDLKKSELPVRLEDDGKVSLLLSYIQLGSI